MEPLLRGHSKMTSPEQVGGRCPKLVTKSDIGGIGVHANSDITTKKICISLKQTLLINTFYLFNTQIHIRQHCGKSVQIRSFFWSVFSCIWTEKTPYLDTFHAVRGQEQVSQIFKHVIGSIVDLSNSCQLHSSYTKCVKSLFKVLNQGKNFSLFAW